MRRKGHPSRPRAITCCFFASLKTLLIPTKATALRRNQRPRASFSLAGFQVTLIGRFWVTAEAPLNSPDQLSVVTGELPTMNCPVRSRLENLRFGDFLTSAPSAYTV